MVKKTGGSMEDTITIDGIIVDKEPVHPAMPKRVEKAKIALLDAALEVKKTEVDAKIEITDPNQMQAFLDEEENMLRKMVDKIKATGATAVFCQKGVDDLVQHYLAKEKIYAVRRVKKSDIEKLAKATGANVVTKVDELEAADLGYAGLIEVEDVQTRAAAILPAVWRDRVPRHLGCAVLALLWIPIVYFIARRPLRAAARRMQRR